MKPGLGNIRKLCDLLFNPQDSYHCIHVGGTNGKGSVASMLASVFMEAGYHVGIFTTPHIHDPRERIRVNGEMISQRNYDNFLRDFEGIIERVKPSFFEMTVALALDHFKNAGVDLAIIEVGMGGRGDATNLIDPVLSVITNVSLDHTEWLGESLEKISYEKAGIIKQGADVVLGKMDEDLLEIFRAEAREKSATIFEAPHWFDIEQIKEDAQGQHFRVFHKGKLLFEDLVLDLRGGFQIENLRVALTVIASTFFPNLLSPEAEDQQENSKQQILRGLSQVGSNTGFKGRMEVLQEDPMVIADICHNEGGMQHIAREWSTLPFKNLHIVWGMVQGKAHEEVLSYFPEYAKVYIVSPRSERGFPAYKLTEKARALGLRAEDFGTVEKGFKAALENAGSEDLIFVGGSTFVVAELLKLFPEK